MKLYAPAYYKDFRCIANRCRHSCCIGWEIDVDEDTLSLYDALDGDYAERIRKSIDYKDTPRFSLAAHDRCPHLDGQGLCRIISAYGQDALCDICREHPRFYHDTPHGKEVGLGMACEEACRLILCSDGFDRMTEIEQLTGEPDTNAFDATALRARAYEILRDATLPYSARLSCTERAFSVSLDALSDNAWCELLDALEYLDEEHRALFMLFGKDAEVLPAQQDLLTRALAYFIYRHCADAADAEDFAASLGLALLLERLLASLIAVGHDAHDAARIISEEIEYSEDNTNILKSVFEVT